MTATTIAGILQIEDSENVLVNTVGQETIYDAIGEYSATLNENLNRIIGLFVEKTTSSHSWKYHMPGNRELQTQGGMARAGEQKFKVSYDVALPIFQFGDALGGTFIDMAYMSVADVDRQVIEITNAGRRTLRKEILKALFNNADLSYDDIKQGRLIVKSLANGDATEYAPLPGYDALATANHFAVTGYATASIGGADGTTNNPIKTHADTMLARFPDEYDAIVFIANNMADYVKGLTNFMEVGDPRIVKGGLADRLTNLPGGVPGKVIGRSDEMWVSVWPDLPPNYSYSIAPSYEKPLQKRIDPPATGLPGDLRLIKQSDLFPLEKSEWMWRFGMGVVNRLNGFVLECGAGGTYTVPTSLER
ncbi:MAG: hypothetical protein PHQ36_05815 [Anaerolineales bacterium]|nr:hypothetical protein [Anaerolineales bacterium]